MKAGFSFTKTFIPEWNGNKNLPEKDQLKAILRMPSSSDVFAIMDRMKAAGSDEVDGIKRAALIVQEAGQYVPEYVTLENAEDFTLQDIVAYHRFFLLATELLNALVEFAQPNEADVKN